MNKKLEELLREKEKKWDTREEWGLTEPWLFIKQAIQEGWELALEEATHLFYNCEDQKGFHQDEYWEGLMILREMILKKETKK